MHGIRGGPAGALVYRLAALDRAMVRAEASGEAQGLALVHWLDWLPVRLAGLGFALVADFDACTKAWRRLADDVQADAGEVLVSSTVRDLIVGSGRELEDRGEHELKGVPGQWRVFAVEG